MFVVLLALALAILFYYYVVKPFQYWKEQGVPEGGSIFGDTWKLAFRLESSLDLVRNVYNRFPGTRYTGIYQFGTATLVVKDPDLIKQVAIKDFDHFVDRRKIVPEDIDPLWGNNLGALEGKKWREMRNLLSPSFTSSKLKSMFGLIKECSEDVVQYFLKKDQEICKVEATELCTRITNDIITSTSLGFKVDSLAEPDNPLFLLGKELTDFNKIRVAIIFFGNLISRHFSRVIRLKLFTDETRSHFHDLINRGIKIREETEVKRPDMITLMVQARKNGQKTAKENVTDLTNADIASQAFIFFLGGFDTVSSLMFFTSYELALNQDIQTRLRQEINDTLEECNGDVTFEGISKMKYMDMVVSESLRKWPIFLSIDRTCTKEYVIEPISSDEKPVHIKEGIILMLPIYGIHHDPKYYPDPEKYDPERFSDENKAKIHPYTYFPFGLGPRNCIGSRFALMETKMVLFNILSKFEIVPTKETEIPVKIHNAYINLRADKTWLGFKRINEPKV